jgi:hypothetical protein
VKLEFSGQILKNTQISISTEIHPVGAKWFHADRQTDRHDEAIGRLSQFYERA